MLASEKPRWAKNSPIKEATIITPKLIARSFIIDNAFVFLNKFAFCSLKSESASGII